MAKQNPVPVHSNQTPDGVRVRRTTTLITNTTEHSDVQDGRLTIVTQAGESRQQGPGSHVTDLGRWGVRGGALAPAAPPRPLRIVASSVTDSELEEKKSWQSKILCPGRPIQIRLIQ